MIAWPKISEGPYAEAWQEYRCRMWTLVLWFVGAAAVGLPAAAWLSMRFDRAGWPLLVWFVVAVAGMSVVVVRHQLWRCPRCGRPFFINMTRWAASPYSRRCRHCGLPKWASSSPNVASQDAL